ncbi:MAG: hypothetical protein HXY40_19000 [Chloroflexi bacterium]|nr:hypothetical protein [Chloroflexota bacterium]
MKYGLSRAIPMGILGFLLGLLLTIGLRAWQGLDPIWDAEVGIILGTLISSILFVWSMGAFDPAMSAHGEAHGDEHAAAEHTHHAPEEDKPGTIVTGYVFQVTTWTIIVLLTIAVFAFWPGGFTVLQTNDALGSTASIGYQTINLFGTDVVFSELTLFLLLVIWTLISLALAGGVIGLVMYALSRQVKQVKGKAPDPAALVPPAPARWLSRGATWLLKRLPEPPQPRR